MGVAAQTLPPIQRYQFETADSERAHAFIRQNYADYSVRFAGSPTGFTFAHTMISAPGLAIVRLVAGMK
jgi:hypothetical protein